MHHISIECTEMAVFILVVEGQNLRYCGVGAGYDDIIINGNLDELKVRVASLRIENICLTVVF